ncbi:MAG: PorT family protein [Sphingobacteriales bacterium]|nr:PorT family protein [Sphingobacteriales bacterium]
MKKISLSIFALSFTLILYAQPKQNSKESKPKEVIGITGGISIASMKAKASGLSFTTDSKVGLTIGVIADLKLSHHFTLQHGLNFTQKGSKINLNFDTDKVHSKETLNYIELPINILYSVEAGKGKFFGGAGPAFNYGIGGKSESTITSNGQTTSDSHNVKFGNSVGTDDYKPLEIAGNIIAGYELQNGLFFSANYNFGINNIAVEDNSGKIHNRYFGLRIGYKFTGSK